MACPTKRKGSDNWYYRRKIPADVRVILDKLPKGQRPQHWFKTDIVISLGTADREKAKAKCPEVAAEVEKHIAALRDGPKPLLPIQIAALSGELYKSFAVGLEDNPVLTAAQWQRVADMNEEARRGEYGIVAALGIHQSDEDRRRASMEARFGNLTDAFLDGRGIVTDAESRWKLIEKASIDLSEAAKKLARNADLDYSPDEYVKKFPPTEKAGQEPTSKNSFKKLVETWHTAALARGVRKRGADRIKKHAEDFITFVGHDDLARLTRGNFLDWADALTRAGKAGSTINRSEWADVKTVLSWGAKREWLKENPARDLGKYNGRKIDKVREEYFTTEEAAAILRTAATVTGSPREAPKTTAAKRWVPWLCAYSGARVAEMIQLRKKDVRKDTKHGWIIRLDPEAGHIKTDKFCDVPVHEHLIATGFIDFVKNAPDGYLFCNLGRDGTITGPAEGVYSRVYKMVRPLLSRKMRQPNHAWRYTFKSYGMDVDIQSHVLDAISNHSPTHQGGKYIKVTLKARAAAIAKFPRYDVGP